MTHEVVIPSAGFLDYLGAIGWHPDIINPERNQKIVRYIGYIRGSSYRDFAIRKMETEAGIHLFISTWTIKISKINYSEIQE